MTAVASSTTPLLAGDERVTSAFVEGFDVGPDTDTRLALRRDRRRILSNAGHAADRRTRVHPCRFRERGQGRHRQRTVRQEVRPRARRRRQADVRATRRRSTSRSWAWSGTLKHSSLRDAGHADVLRPAPPGQQAAGCHDLLRSDVLERRRDRWRPSGRSCCRLDRNLPIERLRTMDERCAERRRASG